MDCFARRVAAFAISFALALSCSVGVALAQARPEPKDVLLTWHRLVLELVRHTPTYSPPVASRAFAYLGITAYEATAGGSDTLVSLAGQLNELALPPQRQSGLEYDEAVVMQAALSFAVPRFFGNTGPTGQRAMDAMATRYDEIVAQGVATDIVERSQAHGLAVAAHIFDWSLDDGGAAIENLGFPYAYERGASPESWVPTSLIALQQTPLLPNWGTNRTFAMPNGAVCPVPSHPDYSEEPGSDFYNQVLEVYEAVNARDPEQIAIAQFWADDPMLSPTPPGHWVSIAMQILRRDGADLEKSVEAFALLGIAMADAFIGCWHEKFEYDLLRPVTFIRRHIDPSWQTVLITPPFPEYPSGHSTQSGAAAQVLTALFGEDFAFEDNTHVVEGLPVREYESFWHAAEEAAISRLYGGIHYRVAIENGLSQGLCIGAYTTALTTRR